MRYIPNILSTIRLLLVGVFILLFSKTKYLACLIVFITAFLTDLSDGYLAYKRRHNDNRRPAFVQKRSGSVCRLVR